MEDTSDKVESLIFPEVNLEKKITKDSASTLWNLPVF